VATILRPMLLHHFHDALFSANLGAWKTYHRIAANFWWPKMRGEVFGYVRRCDSCQCAKPAQVTRVGLHAASPVSQPMDRLFIDFVGPLVRTKKGNVAIPVVVDSFSKFVSLNPVRRTTSTAVLDYLQRGYFPVYGAPKSIVTDNTRVFCGKEFRDMCFMWGIDHLTTTPYYPQSSLAERVNRKLKSALKIYHHESQNLWDDNLPWLGLAFNTAVHESTCSTPDFFFGGGGARDEEPIECSLRFISEC